jgi:ribosomal-protein-alanine N-acetyltransferase
MENHVVFLDLPKTRVYLRPVEKGDLPFFVRAINDEAVNKFLLTQGLITEREEEEWYESIGKRKDHDRVCSIVLKETHEVIGIIGLHKIDWINGTATTGTFIGQKDLWAKGLGTEAKMLLLKYAFFRLNLRQIYSYAYDFNKASLKYSLKCGYVKIGMYPKDTFRDGEYHDVVALMVTRENWENLWLKFEKKMKGKANV